MPEERRISPAVAIIPIGLALAAVVGIAALAWAAPPVVEYTCPYCGAIFATEEELLAHIELEHPGLPPPEGVAEFAYVSGIRNMGTFYPPVVGGGEYWKVQVDIQNIGQVAGVCTIEPNVFNVIPPYEPYWGGGIDYGVQSLELQPNQIGTFEWWLPNIPRASQIWTRVSSEAGTLEEVRIK